MRLLRKAGLTDEAVQVRGGGGRAPVNGRTKRERAEALTPQRVACAAAGRRAWVCQAVARFRAAGGTPKTATYGALVAALALDGRHGDAERWRAEMATHGYALSADGYGAVRACPLPSQKARGPPTLHRLTAQAARRALADRALCPLAL